MSFTKEIKAKDFVHTLFSGFIKPAGKNGNLSDVFVELFFLSEPNGDFSFNNEVKQNISEELGIHVKSVGNCVSDLVAAGIIKKIQREFYTIPMKSTTMILKDKEYIIKLEYKAK